jgi:hypothetical protein
MPAVDPFVSLYDWRTSLYRADRAAIDRFLDAIDATLTPGWDRDVKYEAARPRTDRVRWYLFDQPGDSAVGVGLRRVTDTRVRGGYVQVLRHPSADEAMRIGRLLADFSDGCMLPAAGVRYSRPAFGPRSAVSAVAESLLTKFADTADGEWPLTESTRGLWDELVTACLEEHVGIDRNELSQWLVDSGWEPEVIPAIVERFFADSMWLAERLAAIAP